MLHTLGYALAGALMLTVVAARFRAVLRDPGDVRVIGLAVAHLTLAVGFVSAI